MSDYNRGYARPVAAGAADMSVDAGLRAFMLGVYNKVGLGLVVSGALAWVTSHQPVASFLFKTTASGALAGYTLLGMIVMFSPLVIILASGFLMKAATPQNSGALYWTIVSLIGASMGALLLMYTGMSVATTFFVTAAAFGGLSLVGYTTKKDLSGFGTFLIMGVIGLVIASLVNMFLKAPALAFVINALGVLIFAGLIAYDTQRLKTTYYQLGGDQTSMAVATNYGALNLYLDFINLFQFLLAFLGNRR